MVRDLLFLQEDKRKSFSFTKDVCEVFDDMVVRSVPGYENIQEIILLLYTKFSKNNTFIDVGCSTGTTMHKILNEGFVNHCYGVDLSLDMLEKAKDKCASNLSRITFGSHNFLSDGEWRCIENLRPDFIILNLVLQFIRPVDREKFLRNIQSSCEPKPTLVVFEKIIFPNTFINDIYIDAYLQWKEKNGYSKIEIDNKRIALENKLIPNFDNENINLFRNVGFKNIECCFSFLNFRGYLCY